MGFDDLVRASGAVGPKIAAPAPEVNSSMFDQMVRSAISPSKPTGEQMTQKTIDAALDKVAGIEGGYVNDPDDHGGHTNHGVTLGFYKTLHPNATVEDLKKVSKEQARKLFDTEFVRKPGIDKLPDVAQAEAVALSINAGPAAAVKVLQKAAGVKQDGQIGPKTIEAVGRLTNDMIKRAVDDFYLDIVQKNPSQRKFLRGWLKRSAIVSSIPEDKPTQVATVDVYQDAEGRKFKIDGSDLVEVG